MPPDALQNDPQTASDPATPAPVLRQLYASLFPNIAVSRRSLSDAEREKLDAVGSVLAQNPNTPPDLLQALLPRYPEAIARNPILPLLPLEIPTFWQNADEDALLKMLRLSDVPKPVLEILASGGSGAIAQQAARFHVGLFGEIALEDWQNAARELCRAQPIFRPQPALSREQAADFAKNSKGRGNQLLADWVEIGILPTSFFPDADLPEPIPHARQEIDPKRAGAIRPETSVETLRRLVESSDDNVLIAAILHPNTDADTLRVLLQKRSQHYNNHYAFALGFPVAAARHPNADADLLRLLAEHGEAVVRRLARRHKNAPSDLQTVSWQAVLGPQGNLSEDVFTWYAYTEYAAALQIVLRALHTKPPARWVHTRIKSANPVKRLAAVIALHKRAAHGMASPYPGQRKPSRCEQNRWDALKNDANAVVRAAANAPVTPDFSFIL